MEAIGEYTLGKNQFGAPISLNEVGELLDQIWPEVLVELREQADQSGVDSRSLPQRWQDAYQITAPTPGLDPLTASILVSFAAGVAANLTTTFLMWAWKEKLHPKAKALLGGAALAERPNDQNKA